jgi:hypothetical protein
MRSQAPRQSRLAALLGNYYKGLFNRWKPCAMRRRRPTSLGYWVVAAIALAGAGLGSTAHAESPPATAELIGDLPAPGIAGVPRKPQFRVCDRSKIYTGISARGGRG